MYCETKQQIAVFPVWKCWNCTKDQKFPKIETSAFFVEWDWVPLLLGFVAKLLPDLPILSWAQILGKPILATTTGIVAIGASLVNFQCKGSQFCSWKILRPTLTFQSIWFEVNRMENEFFHHFVQTQWPCPIEQMMRLEVKILEHLTDILQLELMPNWGIN